MEFNLDENGCLENGWTVKEAFEKWRLYQDVALFDGRKASEFANWLRIAVNTTK